MRVRVAAAIVGIALATAGLTATAAFGASKYRLRFVEGHQPQDAEVGDTIKASHLNDAAAFVQVELVDAAGNRVSTSKGPVSFTLKIVSASGVTDAPAGTLHVDPQPLVNGLAEFGTGTLSINTENEPQFTDYALVPFTTKGAFITVDPSGGFEGFDVWEDGEACDGGAEGGGLDDACVATLRGGEDTYTLNAAGTLGTSELTGDTPVLPGLVCDGQDAVFPNSVFSYATTGSGTPVFLSNHITREDWLASANNGQAHAEWCIGLFGEAGRLAWVNNGADFEQQDTDGVGGLDLYVALAPRCPVMNPSSFAPCIVSQTADGMGGSTTLGWLPAGDPPRRT